MAIYLYKCLKCGNIIEVRHKMSEKPEIKCPTCNELMEKKISKFNFILKGKGFYKTDNQK
jgi:putative FmdB family regulatory protein